MPENKKVALYQAGLNRHFRHKVMAHNFTTHQAASDSARSIQAAYKVDMSRFREKPKDEKEKRKMPPGQEQSGGN